MEKPIGRLCIWNIYSNYANNGKEKNAFICLKALQPYFEPSLLDKIVKTFIGRKYISHLYSTSIEARCYKNALMYITSLKPYIAIPRQRKAAQILEHLKNLQK